MRPKENQESGLEGGVVVRQEGCEIQCGGLGDGEN